MAGDVLEKTKGQTEDWNARMEEYLRRHPERLEEFTSLSDISVSRLYTPARSWISW
jgi:hypothetical protein